MGRNPVAHIPCAELFRIAVLAVVLGLYRIHADPVGIHRFLSGAIDLEEAILQQAGSARPVIC
jgi:hypothetical protein